MCTIILVHELHHSRVCAGVYSADLRKDNSLACATSYLCATSCVPVRNVIPTHACAGVYSADLRKDYSLASDEWKYDIMPEIKDGHNVFDFVDADIDARLAELEREENELEVGRWVGRWIAGLVAWQIQWSLGGGGCWLSWSARRTSSKWVGGSVGWSSG